MSPALTPSHLLALYQAFTDDLIHCRFHKRGRDGFIIPRAVSVIGDELLVGRDVPTKLTHGFQQPLAFWAHGFLFKQELEEVDEARGRSDIPIPEMMLQTL